MPAAVEEHRGTSDPGPGPASPSRARRIAGAVFAGDRRVWKAAAAVGLPLALLILVWCLVPRAYYTGTDSAEDYTYVAQTPAHHRVCVYDLMIPARTARLRLRVISLTRQRPPLHLALTSGGQTIRSDLGPVGVGPDRISTAIFAIPERPARPLSTPASLCLTADGLVNWGGASTLSGFGRPPTLNGVPLVARIAVWYLPRAGATRSYLAEAGDIFRRAALFRPGWVGAWTYALIVFALLPALALAAVRCLALASQGRIRRLGLWLWVIAALNAGCWALITPAFQAPDEVDHYAYTQSLVERGGAPSRALGSPLARWSSAELGAIEATRMSTTNQVGDSRAPWLASDQRLYQATVAAHPPPRNDGGGYETAATHGPLYYLALAPAYLAAGHSVFGQLTLMRLTSALIGALTVLFTYLLGRELAPRRPWLAVLAALLVAFEPMYGFMSGVVNNDVGVNAGAAALELLLIRMLRRGVTLPWGVLTGGLLVVLPIVKGTAYSLYPVAGLVFAATLWRHHRRTDLAGWAGVAGAAVVVRELSVHLSGSLRNSAGNTPGVGSAVGSTSSALHHFSGYLAYLWQVFLPRLSFMTPHFESTAYPGFVIFVERGWGAFAWYDIFYAPWVYSIILAVMLATPLLALWAARREWGWLRRHWMEAAALVIMPLSVIAGFEAAYYTDGARPAIAEFGRYAFPAIGPLALLVVGALHAFGRRRMLLVGAGLLAAVLALGYVGQLVTLTDFYG